jgi:hypothetical protein
MNAARTTVIEGGVPTGPPRRGIKPRVIQAWIELRAEDPEAISAAMVATRALAAGRGLRSLRRLRLYELRGMLPTRREVENLLHRSIQFYNPHKERCQVRATARDPYPLVGGEVAVLVFERSANRREGAEHWWEHQTGQGIEVREGVAWLLSFESGVDAPAHALALTVATDRATGLLCNPHAQDHRIAAGGVPLAWFEAGSATDASRSGRRRGTR